MATRPYWFRNKLIYLNFVLPPPPQKKKSSIWEKKLKLHNPLIKFKSNSLITALMDFNFYFAFIWDNRYIRLLLIIDKERKIPIGVYQNGCYNQYAFKLRCCYIKLLLSDCLMDNLFKCSVCSLGPNQPCLSTSNKARLQRGKCKCMRRDEIENFLEQGYASDPGVWCRMVST